MVTTLFGTFNEVSARPPRLIRTASGYFYAVSFTGHESIDGYIVWNDEVYGVCYVCGPDEFYDRFKNNKNQCAH